MQVDSSATAWNFNDKTNGYKVPLISTSLWFSLHKRTSSKRPLKAKPTIHLWLRGEYRQGGGNLTDF
jgi:hypothetical protein